ncbi:MAG: amidohydrolase family protein [Bacteroidota bacterium]|nr:amidohydrolase family protein [Bacteroidota bacterium]
MKIRSFLSGLSIACIFPSIAQTYISNVTIIDVEKKKLVKEQTVLINKDQIVSIQASKSVKPAKGSTVIDGTGKFLMPGMTDAHVHFFQSGGIYTRPDVINMEEFAPYSKEIKWTHDNYEDILTRYLALGITTVIDPGSSYNFLKLKKKYANKSYCPTVYMAGPLITTYKPYVYDSLLNDDPFSLVKTVEQAKQAVRDQLPHNPDLIKIWYIANFTGKNIEDSARKFLPIIKAAIDEAHKYNLRVAVHATERITAQLAVENGCDYLVHIIDNEVVSTDFINLLKKKKVVLCPTLNVMDDYSYAFAQNIQPNFYELTKSAPEPLSSVLEFKNTPDTSLVNYYKKYSWGWNPSKSDSTGNVNLKKMIDAGVTIATGTDAGNIGTFHATSYMKELKAMQKCGADNWQIIQASTINGAKAMGREKETGSIVAKKKASMLLLSANPIDNIENLKTIEMIINNGVAVKPDTLVYESALQLVQHQVNAYNLKNLEAFVEPYAEDIEIYDLEGNISCKGKDEMRKQYAPLFEKYPNLHCEIRSRIIQGSTIIDKEYITGMGDDPFEGVAIYCIQNFKIRKVFFVE